MLQDRPQIFGSDLFLSVDLNVRIHWVAVVANDSSRLDRPQGRLVHGDLLNDARQAFRLPRKACSNRSGLLPARMWLSFHKGLCSDLRRSLGVQESRSGRAGVIEPDVRSYFASPARGEDAVARGRKVPDQLDADQRLLRPSDRLHAVFGAVPVPEESPFIRDLPSMIGLYPMFAGIDIRTQ